MHQRQKSFKSTVMVLLIGLKTLVIYTLIVSARLCKAQQQQNAGWSSYSAAWDFRNASSKLDAATQARTNSLLALFNPARPIVGVQAGVSKCHDLRYLTILFTGIFGHS